MEGSPQTLKERVDACEEIVEQCMAKVAELEATILSLSSCVERQESIISVLRGERAAPSVTGLSGRN